MLLTEPRLIQHTYPGQTEPVESNGAADTDDFLARERAVLGEDASEFATAQDAAATENVDTGDDLLGGAESAPAQQAAPEEVAGFESSFPAVDTSDVQNEVCAPVPWIFTVLFAC
jgi:ABC-type transporter Mla subunit MlaD